MCGIGAAAVSSRLGLVDGRCRQLLQAAVDVSASLAYLGTAIIRDDPTVAVPGFTFEACPATQMRALQRRWPLRPWSFRLPAVQLASSSRRQSQIVRTPGGASPVNAMPVVAEILGPDILIILVVVALLFGSSRLPKLARSLGSAKAEFEKGIAEGVNGVSPVPDTPPGESMTLTRGELSAMIAEREAAATRTGQAPPAPRSDGPSGE